MFGADHRPVDLSGLSRPQLLAALVDAAIQVGPDPLAGCGRLVAEFGRDVSGEPRVPAGSPGGGEWTRGADDGEWVRGDDGEWRLVGGGDLPTQARRYVQAALARAKTLTPEQRRAYAASMDAVLTRMPTRALDRALHGLISAHFFPDKHSLTQAVKGAGCKLAGPNSWAEGAYLGGVLYLDGGRESPGAKAGDWRGWGVGRVSRAGLYAHEMAHAVDGAFHHHSGGAAWGAIYRDEIAPRVARDAPASAPLSIYARTNRAEGWAEFGRLVYGGEADLAAVERTFPRATAYWKEQGFWPAAGPTPAAAAAPMIAPAADGADPFASFRRPAPSSRPLFEPRENDVRPREIDKDEDLRALSAVRKRDPGAWDLPQPARSWQGGFYLTHLPTGRSIVSSPGLGGHEYAVHDQAAGFGRQLAKFRTAEQAAGFLDGRPAAALAPSPLAAVKPARPGSGKLFDFAEFSADLTRRAHAFAGASGPADRDEAEALFADLRRLTPGRLRLLHAELAGVYAAR